MKTEADVAALISWMRRPVVGSRVNCGPDKAHSSPLAFVADVLLGRAQDFIVWANRSGSKSYLAAFITWVQSAWKPLLETTILGGSLEQSSKAYKALGEFWAATGLQDDWLAEEPTKRSTQWANGSLVTVLTASTKSTRGPHPQVLLMDEVDEMAEDVYNSALSQPQSKAGHASMLGKLSTNHRYGGIMDRAVQHAVESGTAFYKWCVWECLASCRDFSCSTCKVSRWCPGTHMRHADGYYSLEDFVKKAAELSETTLQIEWFCEKIGRSDLVYGHEFDEAMVSPLDLPAFTDTLPVLLSIDWGGSKPFSVGAWQEFPLGWVRIDEVYMANTTNPQVIAECKTRPWWRRTVSAVADPSRPDLKGEWEAVGVRVEDADNAVDPGIEAMRNAMRPIGGPPLFYVNRVCQAWLSEVRSYYEKNGRPIKENDHAMDETRYFVRWQIAQLPKRKGRVFFVGKDAVVKEAPKSELQPPVEQPAAVEAPPDEGQPDNGQPEARYVKRRGRMFTS